MPLYTRFAWEKSSCSIIRETLQSWRKYRHYKPKKVLATPAKARAFSVITEAKSCIPKRQYNTSYIPMPCNPDRLLAFAI